VKVGAVLIPSMAATEVIDTIVAAEDVGLDYCLVADESLTPDVYATLGAAARETSRIRLGPVTNGYTRHPAVTATAIASLNDLSAGRAVATLVAGGSMALTPLGIKRDTPLLVMHETIEVMRRLWSGKATTWGGEKFRLNEAQLGLGPQDIPVWIAARGPGLLGLAGQVADGVVLEVRADLSSALLLVDEGTTNITRPDRIYLGQLTYRPEQVAAGVSSVFAHVLMDSPRRQLLALGLTDEEIAAFRSSYESDGPEAALAHVTDEVVRRHQIIGTPEECSDVLHTLQDQLQLETFLFYIKHAGLEENARMMSDIHAIVGNVSSSTTSNARDTS